jgi:hypothetical protein
LQVCECETLHRETFYLSVDLFDRYMSKSRGIETDQLQLVGVTALFVASKIEVRFSTISKTKFLFSCAILQSTDLGNCN